jgi:hypothetical protein
MRRMKGFQCHVCCPAEWRQTQNMTGSYELDATINRMKNTDMRDRLKDHLATGSDAYGPLTAYNGYRNYSGDS